MGESGAFGQALRLQRREAGLTQEQLAERAGLSARGISDLERGLKRPRRDTLALLAGALSWTADERRRWEVSPAHSRGVQGAARVHLPAELTSFVGREDEVQELLQLLRRDGLHLVTLTGVGGVGKTRLAIRLARELAGDFTDGTWFVDLAPLAQPELVAQTVARELGIQESPGVPSATTLVATLESKRCLIVLDNCEHMVEACAQLAETLLRNCSWLMVLATSREALALTGEVLWPVPPLCTAQGSLPLEQLATIEAIRLFCERAAAVAPSFRLAAANAAAVADICSRLDGLPLAIELAAARTAILSPRQLAERLDDRFAVLTNAGRRALPRHQTLRGLIDWSYKLLTAEEGALFRRVSVFAGGWTLEAAEIVCSATLVASEAVLDLLGSLVAKSLIVAEDRDGTTRFRLLETLREYAAVELSGAGETEVTTRRHAEYCLVLAEGLRELIQGADELAALEKQAVEYDNCRAALRRFAGEPLAFRLTGALAEYWSIRDHAEEAQPWLNRCVDRPEAEGMPAWVWIARTSAIFAARMGQREQSKALFERGRQAARVADDDLALAWIACADASMSGQSNDWQREEAAARESVAAFQRAGKGERAGLAMALLGSALWRQGRMDEAAVHLDEGLRLSRVLGNPTRWILTCTVCGRGAVARGQLAEAKALFSEAGALAATIGQVTYLEAALIDRGHVALLQSDQEEAVDCFSEALDHIQDAFHLNRVDLAKCLAGLAYVAAGRNQIEEAACLYGFLSSLRNEIGLRPSPIEASIEAKGLERVRQQLDERSRVEAWTKGRHLSQDAALELARQILNGATTGSSASSGQLDA